MSTEHHHHHTGISGREEAKALLEYMVKHNVSHTQELAQLAAQLHESSEVREALTNALAAYEKGNALLADALNKME